MLDEAWANELAFSDWLYNNLSQLSEAVGTVLQPRAREARVGGFSADLLAETSGNEPVIIENQIFKADHGHFGQVLTYAAFYDAAIIVWIARGFRNEYREAIGWLNRLSRKQFLAIELSGIGPSDCSFAVVAGPAPLLPVQATDLVTLSPSPAALGEAQFAAYVRAPYAVRLPAQPRANISPGQVFLNGIFEEVASRVAALRLTAPRKPSVDRNFSEFAAGPVKHSHWALTFEGDDAAVALVFFGNDSHERVAQVEGRAHDIEALAGVSIKFDVKPLEHRIKTKVMVYRNFRAPLREASGEEIVSWSVATFAALYNALEQLQVFSGDARLAPASQN
ncbi:MAG: hypothetical protein ACRENA_01560 [Vulcanimicrobiaceae bacterium]